MGATLLAVFYTILEEWAAPDEDSSAVRLMRDGIGEVHKEIAK